MRFPLRKDMYKEQADVELLITGIGKSSLLITYLRSLAKIVALFVHTEKG
jgi:hypothetical protein